MIFHRRVAAAAALLIALGGAPLILREVNLVLRRMRKGSSRT